MAHGSFMTNNNHNQSVSNVYIITGGTSGLGLATARRLIAEGARVVLASRNADRGATVARELSAGGAEVRFIQTDVRRESEAKSLVDETMALFGRLDGVFNNAGVEGTVGPMAAWSTQDVDETLDTNVKGAFYIMKHAATAMKRQGHGRIVNCSSILGLEPIPIAGLYAASKAALLHLTRCAAAELAEDGVSVTAVCPTVVDTSMMDRVSELAGAPKEGLAQMVCPSGQLGDPKTIGSFVAELLSGSRELAPGDAIVVTQSGTYAVKPGAAMT